MNVVGMRKYLLLAERWKELRVPVTCLWGDKDVWAMPDLAREIQTKTSFFKTVVITNAGHAPWFDDRERILAEINKALT
jgi:pimeloyl-ACP methyl ester carboxylesterase